MIITTIMMDDDCDYDCGGGLIVGHPVNDLRLHEKNSFSFLAM
jgi:hypothetical protein